MQIFDELKTRGVEDVLFISMDGVSGLGVNGTTERIYTVGQIIKS